MQDATESPDTKDSFRAMAESTNLMDKFTEQQSEDLATQCSEGFEYDLESRREWADAAEEWTRLALQIRGANIS